VQDQSFNRTTTHAQRKSYPIEANLRNGVCASADSEVSISAIELVEDAVAIRANPELVEPNDIQRCVIRTARVLPPH
jgi:hypothetical protein